MAFKEFKKSLNKKLSNDNFYNFIFTIVLTVVVLALTLVIIFPFQRNFRASKGMINITKAFTCRDDSGLFVDCSPGIHKTDAEYYVYSTIIDERYSEHSYLIWTYKQKIEVKIDDIYIFSVNDTDFNKKLRVNGYVNVVTPAYDQYAVLEIFIYAENGYIQLDNILRGTQFESANYILLNELLTIVIVGISFIIGVMLIIVLGIGIIRLKYFDYKLLPTFFFILFIAIWALTDSPILQIFNFKAEVVSYISYIVYMLLPLPVISYVDNRLSKKFLLHKIFLVIFTINTALQIALSSLGLATLNNLIIITDILMFISVTCCVVTCAVDIKKNHTRSDLLNLIGVSLLLVLGTTSAILYLASDRTFYRPLLLLGLVLMFASMMYTCAREYLNSAYENKSKLEQLELEQRKANIDILTGLENRVKYEEEMNRIKMNPSNYSNLCLVMMDMNGLKFANDTFGHKEGDMLLHSCGKAIDSTYGRYGKCYRIGGDEFAIILDEKYKSIEDINTEFDDYVIRFNEEREDLLLSVSKGYHFLKDTTDGSNIEEWQEEADLNLYIEKKNLKYKLPFTEKDAMFSILHNIADIAELKSKYLMNHSYRVSEMSCVIAKELGMSQSSILAIQEASLLHDIGKISIPDDILDKNGKLTDEEYEIMKGHPVTGEYIIKKSAEFIEISKVIRHHHERWDGKGYPDGLKGKDIPIESRIIALADSIDAMTSDRCYRRKMDNETCKMEIEKNLGLMYDPAIGKIVLKIFDEKIANIIGTTKPLA